MEEQQRIDDWLAGNQACLVHEFARLKKLLGAENTAPSEGDEEYDPTGLEPPAAIDQITAMFDLSSFERDVLLLCAGVEMDSQIAALCAAAHGRTQAVHATFGLALAILPVPHWTALAPIRPLRKFRLVDVGTGSGLTNAPLRIDERILHYLAGINLIDPRLQTVVRVNTYPDWIADEHAKTATQAARRLAVGGEEAPVLHLCGDDQRGQEDVAALAAHHVGLQLFTLPVDDLQAAGLAWDVLAALWERESLLLPGLLLIQIGPSGLSPTARLLVEKVSGPFIVASREPIRLERPFMRFDVDKPRPVEQRRLWEKALGDSAANWNGALDYLSDHFRLSARTIVETGACATNEAGEVDPNDLWNACR